MSESNIVPMESRERDRTRSRPSSNRDIFVNNIPFNVSQAGVEAALKRIFSKSTGYVGIKRVVLQKGIAFVTFDSAENAEHAVSLNQDQSLGPRKLFVQLSDEEGSRAKRLERGNRGSEHSNEGSLTDSHPNADCWFCLGNPAMETMSIYCMDPGASVYLNAAKGPVTKFHSLLCPVAHFSCFAAMSPEVRTVCSEYVDKYCRILEADDFQVVYFERWIPLPASAANHMQVNLIPIPAEKSAEIDWVRAIKTRERVNEIQFIPVRDHEAVVEKMRGILGRVSYLFISFPGKRGGSRENWLGIGRMAFDFPREIICTALSCPERIDWRNCRLEESVQEEVITALKSKFS